MHPTTKVSDEVNSRTLPIHFISEEEVPTTVQLSASTPTLSATVYSVTDRQTDRRHHYAKSRS